MAASSSNNYPPGAPIMKVSVYDAANAADDQSFGFQRENVPSLTMNQFDG